MSLGFGESHESNKFEGLWYSDKTSFHTLITHNENSEFYTINTFSLEDDTVVLEHIICTTSDRLELVSFAPENNWKINIAYTIVNDTIMKATFNGATSETLVYKKFKL